MKKHMFTALAAMVAMSFGPAALAAASYGTAGLVFACADSIGCSEQRLINADDVPSLFDFETIVNPSAGNIGDALYFANLATASVGASASARNGADPEGRIWGAQARSYTRMFDTLRFTLEIGQSPLEIADDLVLTLRGSVNGSIATVGYGEASASFFASIGSGAGAQAAFNSGSVKDGAGLQIAEPFILTTTLFRAGAYTETAVKDVFVEFSLGQQSVLTAAAYNDIPGLIYSTADVSFANTLTVTSMSVPNGVGWTSASGVFMSQPVPEPATVALWLAGLGVIGFALRGPRRTAA